MASGRVTELDGGYKKYKDECDKYIARKEANMSDEIRFPDTWCEGTEACLAAPNSEEYIKVQQSYGSFDFNRPRVGQVCE